MRITHQGIASIATMTCRVGFVCMVLLVLQPAVRAAGAPRQAAPSAADQKEALAAIKDVFGDDYKAAKKSTAKKDFARKLLQQALETDDDPATQYVCLLEVCRLAGEAGDVPTLVKSAQALSQKYKNKTSATAFKLKLYAVAKRGARKGNAALQLANAYAALVNEAIQADDYETALKANAEARTAARKAKDKALAGRAKDRLKSIREMQSAAKKAAVARKALAATPDDPAHNLTLGKFLCFSKREWAAGLPYLAKGSDEALQSLARTEMGKPKSELAYLAIGDGYYKEAKKERPKSESVGMFARSGYWYKKAQPLLKGLKLGKVEKRLIEIEKISGTVEASAESAAVVLQLIRNVTSRKPKMLTGNIAKDMKIKGFVVVPKETTLQPGIKLTATSGAVFINYSKNVRIYPRKIKGAPFIYLASHLGRRFHAHKGVGGRSGERIEMTNTIIYGPTSQRPFKLPKTKDCLFIRGIKLPSEPRYRALHGERPKMLDARSYSDFFGKPYITKNLFYGFTFEYITALVGTDKNIFVNCQVLPHTYSSHTIRLIQPTTVRLWEVGGNLSTAIKGTTYSNANQLTLNFKKTKPQHKYFDKVKEIAAELDKVYTKMSTQLGY